MMSNGRNADKFPLRDLLQTVLHAHWYLQHTLDIVICHLQGDAQLQSTNTTGDDMSYNTVVPGLNTSISTNIINENGNAIDHQNTDAEVPNVTVHNDDHHQDTEAREEVTGVLLDD